MPVWKCMGLVNFYLFLKVEKFFRASPKKRCRCPEKGTLNLGPGGWCFGRRRMKELMNASKTHKNAKR